MTQTDLDVLTRSTASGLSYGVTSAGFVPKPIARLLAEKIALARELFGADVDLTSGSALRTLLELQCVEERADVDAPRIAVRRFLRGNGDRRGLSCSVPSWASPVRSTGRTGR